jgi:hypothetical protein
MRQNYDKRQLLAAGDPEGQIVRIRIDQAINQLSHDKRNPDEPLN